MLSRLINQLSGNRQASKPAAWQRLQQYRELVEREYIDREAQLGAEVFGPVPSGRERQFFCLDKHTWIWYESWKAKKGQPSSFTVRYEVRSDGVFKRINEGSLTKLSMDELEHFDTAVRKYYENVVTKVYGRKLASA